MIQLLMMLHVAVWLHAASKSTRSCTGYASACRAATKTTIISEATPAGLFMNGADSAPLAWESRSESAVLGFPEICGIMLLLLMQERAKGRFVGISFVWKLRRRFNSRHAYQCDCCRQSKRRLAKRLPPSIWLPVGKPRKSVVGRFGSASQRNEWLGRRETRRRQCVQALLAMRCERSNRPHGL